MNGRRAVCSARVRRPKTLKAAEASQIVRQVVASSGSARSTTKALALFLLVACGESEPEADRSPDAGTEPVMPVTIIEYCHADEARCDGKLLEICMPFEVGASLASSRIA